MSRAPRPLGFAVTERQIGIIRAWARSKRRVEQVRLFGSRCKGVHRPDSDLDIALTVSDDLRHTRAAIWFLDVPQWRAELTALLGIPADLRITDLGDPCRVRQFCAEAGDTLIYDVAGHPT
ncbi:hypothetical protein GCM10010994_11910 [Chelatococcus reniformis]|uniref:Polymerase beta nucleotidyltransferase domain-containing protein n=2 Tax=Chelatococcus reniformis TaxID=1494448 RepID=A0A916U085_9HYPH|nr:hypothetical protein GCM10010994_11910 [Chelatococcus reniformis]